MGKLKGQKVGFEQLSLVSTETTSQPQLKGKTSSACLQANHKWARKLTYCGSWLKPVFVGLYRGIESFQGFSIGGAKWTSSILHPRGNSPIGPIHATGQKREIQQDCHVWGYLN